MSTYRWDAQDYAKHSKAQQKWARELIADLNLRGDEKVLDVGCGDGKVTAEIARLLTVGGSVIGVDNSIAMIELARESHLNASCQNLDFQWMDAGDLTFSEDFDLVFSNSALHWVKNHRPVFEGLYKSLRPGGRICLRMGGKGTAAGIISAMNKIKDKPFWSEYFAGFEFPYNFSGSDECRELLRACGFFIHHAGLVPKDMIHEGKDGLKAWIRTTWIPYTERVPEEKRETFIEEVSAQYLGQFPLDADGRAHLSMILLEVVAEKPM